jgi:hypothetical protein
MQIWFPSSMVISRSQLGFPVKRRIETNTVRDRTSCTLAYIWITFSILSFTSRSVRNNFLYFIFFSRQTTAEKLSFSHTYRFFPTRTLCLTETDLSFLKTTKYTNIKNMINSNIYGTEWYSETTRCKFIHTTQCNDSFTDRHIYIYTYIYTYRVFQEE